MISQKRRETEKTLKVYLFITKVRTTEDYAKGMGKRGNEVIISVSLIISSIHG